VPVRAGQSIQEVCCSSLRHAIDKLVDSNLTPCSQAGFHVLPNLFDKVLHDNKGGLSLSHVILVEINSDCTISRLLKSLGYLSPYFILQRLEFLPELLSNIPDIVAQVNASVLARAW